MRDPVQHIPKTTRSRREMPIARAVRTAAASIRWMGLVLLALFGASGLTVVEPDEIAVILRFGRLVGSTPGDQIHHAGLLFALPYPMDEVIRVPVRREGELLIDDVWKPLSAGEPDISRINPIREGYLLTGDQNLIQTRLLVKYRITEPVAFVLRHRSAKRLLRDSVLASLSQTVSGWNVDATLRQQAEVDGVNESLASATLRRAQTRIDAVEYGLTLSALEFQELHPPRHVVAEFQQVQSARITIDTAQREAEGFAAREIPKAESERNRLITEATTFANAITTTANAEVSVFRELLTLYRRQPDLVRQRLYHETLEEALSQVGHVQYVSPHTRLMIPGNIERNAETEESRANRGK